MLFTKLNELITKINQDDVFKDFKVEFLTNTMALANPYRIIIGTTSFNANNTMYTAQKTVANIGILFVLKLEDNLTVYDTYISRFVSIASTVFDLVRIRDVDVRVNTGQKLIYIFVGLETQYITHAW